VAISHAVVLAGALLTLLSVPCALAVIVNADEAAIKRAWVRKGRNDRRALRILDRTLGQAPCRDSPESWRDSPESWRDSPESWRDRPESRRDRPEPGRDPLDEHGDGLAAREQGQPAIEQIAAELRRLDRQRRGGPTQESETWSAAVARAYDEWLRTACRRLDVAEHLSTLDGVDRDIERVRVEAELETAGLVLRSA
jgi:hypothetical protein